MDVKSARVLFIERNLRNEKLGIMYLSASLKQHGHHADLIQIDKEDIHYKIRQYRPHFIAFSITSGEHVFALKVAAEIKQQYNIPNIFGGPHCTFFPEIALDPIIDFVVQGQGEQAILDIVDGRVKPGLHKAPMVKNLDDMPFPDREIFYQFSEFRDNPVKNIITSRACPYRCAYCYNHSQIELTKMDHETKNWFSRRSVQNVIDEIQQLQSKYIVEKLIFIDDSFIQSRKWLNEFLNQYAEQVKLPWLCSLRANCFDEKIAEDMYRSNLEMINYAIESADPDVQQHLLNRGNISNGDVLRAISLFSKYDVRARMQNMIGQPLQNTLEDALNTLQFNLHHPVTDSWCSIFQPYPRTALGKYCLEHGYVTQKNIDKCHESFFDESILNINNKSEIFALQKFWYFIIDGKIPLDLVQILIKGQLSKSLADQIQELRFQCSRTKLYGIKDNERNLQNPIRFSREKIFNQQSLTQVSTLHASNINAPLIEKALAPLNLPRGFTELVKKIPYDKAQTQQLIQYLAGKQVFPKPIYTINDETGELKDPKVSIYIRGTSDSEKMKISNISPVKFMDNMSGVRDQLINA